MTLQEAAQTALEVQNACNLSGVLASFHHVVIDALWPEARRLNKGTEWVNQHPICTLFLDKLSDLNRRGDFYSAYNEVEHLAKAHFPQEAA
jgi:DTW domain-containing protein YfiP